MRLDLISLGQSQNKGICFSAEKYMIAKFLRIRLFYDFVWYDCGLFPLRFIVCRTQHSLIICCLIIEYDFIYKSRLTQFPYEFAFFSYMHGFKHRLCKKSITSKITLFDCYWPLGPLCFHILLLSFLWMQVFRTLELGEMCITCVYFNF